MLRMLRQMNIYCRNRKTQHLEHIGKKDNGGDDLIAEKCKRLKHILRKKDNGVMI